MKIANIMNFVRQIDERFENSTQKMLDLTTKQLRLVNEYGLPNTFLLQYDALCDKDFVCLFKEEATKHTELGLWYEIVAPLTEACGIPYRSEQGWKWDWHITPGFSMSYTPAQREALIDEAMDKFKKTFGYYPKTVASWLIDTHTLNYLAEHYDIEAIAICRDQANTDAYTLLGGYFNQAYYPSKNNIFTPAQTQEMQCSIPVFRLLGPCPIHNYDNNKYSSDTLKAEPLSVCFTLEPSWYMGSQPKITDWMFDCYYGQESLGFAYAQIGQENSFFRAGERVLEATRTQIDQLLARGDVLFQTMSQSGAAFRGRFPTETPATAVIAPNNFDDADAQSVYYDCKNYTANLFRFEDAIFFRSLYLFDERQKDRYLQDICTTFDAVYENLPVIDTMTCADEDKKNCGLLFKNATGTFQTEKTAEGVLRVSFGEDAVTFFPDRIEISAKALALCKNSIKAEIAIDGNEITFTYREANYRLSIEGADILSQKDRIEFIADKQPIVLRFEGL